ncbi:hypothetical protein PGRAT_03335 [Paenibacillus graminis]|uniref:Uncharacterized protein n=1 Tax=Paenibacillus graminis TaxID=189425 RepID=A0A089NCU5_9BACL|nr:hypothetical protein PGRAT_03335 [Paenibacillus graminis]
MRFGTLLSALAVGRWGSGKHPLVFMGAGILLMGSVFAGAAFVTVTGQAGFCVNMMLFRSRCMFCDYTVQLAAEAPHARSLHRPGIRNRRQPIRVRRLFLVKQPAGHSSRLPDQPQHSLSRVSCPRCLERRSSSCGQESKTGTKRRKSFSNPRLNAAVV